MCKVKCGWKSINLGFKFGGIGEMCVEAIQIADALDADVTFVFNGVNVTVTKDSKWAPVADMVLEAVSVGKLFVRG